MEELSERFPHEREGVKKFYGECWAVFNSLNSLELKSLEEPRYLLGGKHPPSALWHRPAIMLKPSLYQSNMFLAQQALHRRLPWPAQCITSLQIAPLHLSLWGGQQRLQPLIEVLLMQSLLSTRLRA